MQPGAVMKKGAPTKDAPQTAVCSLFSARMAQKRSPRTPEPAPGGSGPGILCPRGVPYVQMLKERGSWHGLTFALNQTKFVSDISQNGMARAGGSGPGGAFFNKPTFDHR